MVKLSQLQRSLPLLALPFFGDCSGCGGPDETAAGKYIVVDGRLEEVVGSPNADVDVAVRTEMVRQKIVGVAVGIVESGQTRYAKGYGAENAADDLPVIANATMFRWASMSKMITGIVAAQLWREGTLNPDADISLTWPRYRTPSIYVDDEGGNPRAVPSNARTQTVRQLLGHLGGIQHYDNGEGSVLILGTNDPEVNAGIEWAAEKVIGRNLIAIPGSRYSYSSYGFNIAGVVLERLTGQTFAALAHERVVKRAHLANLQPDYEWANIAHRAHGYTHVLGESVDSGSSDVSWKLPSGGFISTVTDLAAFCGALKGTALMDQTAKDMAWKRQSTTAGDSVSYGWGFGVHGNTVSHGGAQQKARTELRYRRDQDKCFVVMSNTEDTDTGALLDAIEAAWDGQ